jgi:hypothetical protein
MFSDSLSCRLSQWWQSDFNLPPGSLRSKDTALLALRGAGGRGTAEVGRDGERSLIVAHVVTPRLLQQHTVWWQHLYT